MSSEATEQAQHPINILRVLEDISEPRTKEDLAKTFVDIDKTN
jgi:hypothetical protein